MVSGLSILKIFSKCYTVNDIIYSINHHSDEEDICINIGSFNEFNVFCRSVDKKLDFSNVKYVRFYNQWAFEDIVKVLSKLEDSYDIEPAGIDISILSGNYSLFYELIDFYGYDIQINIIANNDLTPFQIIDEIFQSPDIPSFCKYGISLDILNLNCTIWLNDSIMRTTQKYIFSVYNSSNRVYCTR